MSQSLVNMIQETLETPRELTAKQAVALCTEMEVDDPLEGLRAERMAELEEWQAELLISPLFTPHLEERAQCEAVLPPEGASDELLAKIPGLLMETGVRTPIHYGQEHIRVAPTESALERYVRLLNINHSVPATVAERIGALMPESARLQGMALARCRVWVTPTAAQLLETLTSAMVAHGSLRVEKLAFLADFVRSNRPKSADELVDQLKNLVESYKTDAEHPVFSQDLESGQTVNIRSKYCGDEVKAQRLAMAHEVMSDLNSNG
ncbi:hypothetical protein [Magnetofaba australis]|uniref:Uncharacterized protein n=1 Tax=Magnetofaba australis IT-1 TaxID=1434232 RepID=A0A1Y2K9Y1_9PROT|nr:hypothetical protein [Magnetofaba australis]OSM08467.1 hypothetical protein MAIT1_04620 [Magnetofaba australis IT-1]